jgi:hypothetical protein
MTGLPIFAVLVGKRCPKAIASVIVKSSEDAFIDADGLHPLIEILDQAGVSPNDPDGWEMQEISPKTLLNWSNSGRLPPITRSMVPKAKKKAREILARLGIATLSGRTGDSERPI